MGISKSNIFGSYWGAESSNTLLGPPERITALGFLFIIESAEVLEESISEKTCCSRILLAINCVYWEPKSRMTTPPWCNGFIQFSIQLIHPYNQNLSIGVAKE